MRESTPAAGGLSSTVAKWLIPSVSALFVVVGYVVQAAQQTLLGIGAEGWDQGGYVGQASSFFRDLVTRVADVTVQLLSDGQVPLRGHFADLAVATLVAVLVMWAPLGLRLWRPVLLPALLLTLLVAKFLAMDAPLAQVQNVVLGADRVQPMSALPSTGRSLLDRLEQQAGLQGPEGAIARRAEQLWSLILCSRVNAAALQRPDLQRLPACQQSQQDNRNALTGEFTAQLWAGALLVALALALLRSASGAGVALGALALAYTLSVPHAYGKLMKSTYYDYGLVRLAPTLAAARGSDAEAGQVYALLVARTAASTSALVVERGTCGNGAPYSAVQLSSFSPSQVLSVDQIYREDVITWATLRERPCPAICPPMAPNCR